MLSQAGRYNDFYGRFETLRKIFRFDIRYRCRRIHEVLKKLKVSNENISVLDFGFGSGDLLASFPESCSITGVDVSRSAVETARTDQKFNRFNNIHFETVPEYNPEKMINEKFDIIISSHSIEHVQNDTALLDALKKRLKDDGHLVIFAPIEEPDYILFHLRNYSMQSIQEKVLNAGFDIVFCEGSMYINGHIWKILTIPSRRNWPYIGKAVNAFRLFTLSLIPYKLVKIFDLILFGLGAGPRQVMIVAKKRA